MKPEIKTKWIEALRSGEYSQTQEALKDENGFCCLGVLCDIHSKETNTEWDYDFNGYYLGTAGTIPDPVQKWAGLKGLNSSNPHTKETVETPDSIDGECRNASLTILNDNGKSFNEIADVIKRDL